MRTLFFLILVFLLPLSYAKPLLIGTTSQNPPFNSLADQKDHFYGFDIDIMGEICRRIKSPCQFTPLVFNDLFTQLANNKIDLATAAIIITPERQQQFLFSLPYLESSAQFMVTQESTLTNPNHLTNKNIGTRLGTPFAGIARNIYKNQIHVTEFRDIGELLDGLNDGDVDAVLMDTEAARNWYSNTNSLYKLIGTPIPVGNGYGIMANKDRGILIEQINQALLNLEADGTYLRIYNHYFSN